MPATEEYWRNLPSMHRVFAGSAVALFLATMWMMAVDHDDEWRPYQKQFQKLQAEKLREKESQIKTPAYTEEVMNLSKKIDAVKAELNRGERRAELNKARAVASKATGEFARADRETKENRAKRDVDRANYDLAVRDNRPESELAPLKATFDQTNAKVAGLEVNLQKVLQARDAAIADVARLEKDETELESQRKKLEAEFERNHKALAKIEPDTTISRFKRTSMEWPILDGFNSHLKIQQDWMPGLTINYGGMKDVARFDRCRTCHQGIDLVEAGNVPAFPADKYPQPFSTHPRPDVYLTAASPHPIGKFGCTICHEGQGSGTSFQNASHGPNSPDVAHKWEHDHKWFHNHFWEFPMLPERFTEAGCIKCHHDVVELGVNPKFGATAPKVVEGFNLVQQYGCFGCHEINGFDGPRSIGPDLRLEPGEEEAEKYENDPSLIAGKMRKVGPSLVHLADKTTTAWTEFWTVDPQQFRPDTRMPKFFNLEGHTDPHAAKLTPVEISSLVHYLFEKSTPNKLLPPAEGYVANAERGKQFFSRRGCLSCHSHEDFPGVKEDFGPNLSHVHKKIRSDETGRNWVYNWIRNPQLHHPRSKMPNLYLESYEEGGVKIDEAADIAAYLLEKGPAKYEPISKDSEGLHELAVLYLSKALTKAQVDEVMNNGWYPETKKENIKGDEIELFTGPRESGKKLTEDQLVSYVGRRTISRYGCYGCHDIPGFEKARPIGTGLNNWGRKAKNKLALEHIHEYLHHHGEPDGSSSLDRAQKAMKLAVNDGFSDPETKKRETSFAFFYDQVSHGERAGFLWQKLRAPRSYDYMKVETKGFDERLRMPKFPFNDQQIEAVSTFILGLVAEPPAEKYVYRPEGPAKARIEGEKLITKFNCASCHMLQLPEVKFAVDPESLPYYESPPTDFPAALEMLQKLKPARKGETGQIFTAADESKLPVIGFHGLMYQAADPEDPPEDREYLYDTWESLNVAGKLITPGTRLRVPEMNRVSTKEGRGGDFALWLVDSLMSESSEPNRFLAWQSSPPPLYLEGIKVQTPWLYNFLKNPIKLRHTTVLRMPRFNMSDSEALALANYFAAVDGAMYPYQNVPQREQTYISSMEKAHPGYLGNGWKLFQACIQCHAVAGVEYKASDPKKDIRGPNLVNVPDRLRPDWLMLWLYKPNWITPYTSMPPLFDRSKPKYPEIFEGDGGKQVISVRDALINYDRLTETQDKLTRPAPPTETAEAPKSEEK